MRRTSDHVAPAFAVIVKVTASLVARHVAIRVERRNRTARTRCLGGA